MARMRRSDENILKLLREIELNLASGNDVPTACRAVGTPAQVALDDHPWFTRDK